MCTAFRISMILTLVLGLMSPDWVYAKDSGLKPIQDGEVPLAWFPMVSGGQGSDGQDGCSPTVSSKSNGCITITPRSLVNGQCTNGTPYSVCDGNDGQRACAPVVTTETGSDANTGCKRIKSQPQILDGDGNCTSTGAGSATYSDWICEPCADVVVAQKVTASGSISDSGKCSRTQTFAATRVNGVCTASNTAKTTSAITCPGEPGTGIVYQGSVADCTELKTHNGATQGYAWYKNDNGLLYVSDGSSTTFNSCPSGGVQWRGEPGERACAPVVTTETGEGANTGCKRIKSQPQVLGSNGNCTDSGSATYSDWICEPCADVVVAQKVTASGSISDSGKCSRTQTFAATRVNGVCTASNTAKSTSAITCPGEPGTDACAPVIKKTTKANGCFYIQKQAQTRNSSGLCVDSGTAENIEQVCDGQQGPQGQQGQQGTACQARIVNTRCATSGTSERCQDSTKSGMKTVTYACDGTTVASTVYTYDGNDGADGVTLEEVRDDLGLREDDSVATMDDISDAISTAESNVYTTLLPDRGANDPVPSIADMSISLLWAAVKEGVMKGTSVPSGYNSLEDYCAAQVARGAEDIKCDLLNGIVQYATDNSVTYSNPLESRD